MSYAYCFSSGEHRGASSDIYLSNKAFISTSDTCPFSILLFFSLMQRKVLLFRRELPAQKAQLDLGLTILKSASPRGLVVINKSYVHDQTGQKRPKARCIPIS
jgi:hypothetical protein